jgi:hypothetical protein
MTPAGSGQSARKCAVERDLFTHDEPMPPFLDPEDDWRPVGWDISMPHSFSSVGVTWAINITVKAPVAAR